MDYNQIATDIIAELKTLYRRTDSEIAERLGICRQTYLRRRDNNALTTEDITRLSAWLVTAFGGGFYFNKHWFATAYEATEVRSGTNHRANTEPNES